MKLASALKKLIFTHVLNCLKKCVFLALVGFPPYLPKLLQAKQSAVCDIIYPEALCGLA